MRANPLLRQTHEQCSGSLNVTLRAGASLTILPLCVSLIWIFFFFVSIYFQP